MRGVVGRVVFVDVRRACVEVGGRQIDVALAELELVPLALASTSPPPPSDKSLALDGSDDFVAQLELNLEDA